MTATTSYFGDTTLGLRQMVQTIDKVFDTMVLLEAKDVSKTLRHDQVIAQLCAQPALQPYLPNKVPHQVHVGSDEDTPWGSSSSSTDNDSQDNTQTASEFLKEQLIPTTVRRYEDDNTAYTSVSSVLLSPIARVQVKQ
ncbi:MAG: hypothetical protein AAGM67_21050 [Bacteroidota bacterium]